MTSSCICGLINLQTKGDADNVRFPLNGRHFVSTWPAELVWKYLHLYAHFVSLPHIEITQVFEIFSMRKTKDLSYIAIAMAAEHLATQTAGILFNTLRLRQDGRHFPNDIFKCIFLNENVWISIKISLIIIVSDNGLAPTRRQAVIWTNDGLVYWRIYASLGLNDLTHMPEAIHYIVEHNGGSKHNNSTIYSCIVQDIFSLNKYNIQKLTLLAFGKQNTQQSERTVMETFHDFLFSS